MYQVFLGLLISFVFLWVCPTVFASGESPKPIGVWVALSQTNPFPLQGEIRVSLIAVEGVYHLTLPESQTNSSLGRNIINENLKQTLNEPFFPSGERAYRFQPEGIPPTVTSPNMYDNHSFSFSQLTNIYLNKFLDQYIIPKSIKKMIPKSSGFSF